MNEKYCEHMGDGVYAHWVGYGIELLANDHLGPTDIIFIEPEVLEAINNFYKRMKHSKLSLS